MYNQLFSFASSPAEGSLRAGEVISFPDTMPLRDQATPARIALVGTYAPRKCGIAAFTADVADKLRAYHPEIASTIYALDHGHSTLEYSGIAALIDCDDRECYAGAARHINESGVDAVWLQHEFGIFGGTDGDLVCEFVDRLAAPLIVTFHTVLAEPSANQERIVRHLLRRASKVMVMSCHGRDLLRTRYDADASRIEVIAHGAPDRPFGREDAFKQALGLAGRNVLMTFGLLGPGKGLEQMIEALPAIVSRHPGTVYRIVGATHPNLVARDGESYREGLMALAERLGVAGDIEWDNRFVDTDELLDQLEACDIYVTPYHNLQQATSGTLSYAVALGKAVVSTPYVHARELLAGGVGVLVEPGSTKAIAAAINGLLDDPVRLEATKRRAYQAGRATIWSRFAEASAALIRGTLNPISADLPITAIPGKSGFFAMCDSTGMFQHAIGIVPDRRHGYCLDDNARALILMNLAEGLSHTERLQWSSTFASFIQYAWNDQHACFRNFMRFDRGWCEEVGSEDSSGRAIWALGHTAAHSPDADIRAWGRRWFDIALPHFALIDSPRALAFAMLGAAAVIRVNGQHSEACALIERGGALLSHLLLEARRPGWTWFEAVLAYDNPRLPQALIEAGSVLGRPDWTSLGVETLDWISQRQTATQGHFRPVGSETFGRQYDQLPFDQQPLEAQAAVEAAACAFAVTGNPLWIDRALAAYRWFLGANDRGALLADLVTGRCRDGVTPHGVNENCGAESILGFQLAHVALVSLLRDAGTIRTTGKLLGTKPDRTRDALAYP